MFRRGLQFAGFVSAAVLTFSPGALANTYRPNKTGDHAVNGCTHSDCTVREALNKANTHLGADTIVLKGSKVYNVTLNPANVEDENAAADLDVNDDLTIKRSGRGFAVLDAHGGNRVLDVGPAGGVSAKLKSIWVRHGFSNVGGGIRSGGPFNPPPGDDHLILIHGRVTGSRTIGPSGYGGGIENAGHGTTLKIVRSTISGNTSGGGGDGGGIHAGDIGTLRVVASTISGNTVQDGTGGGIDLINGATRLELINSTIANNKASNDGGGIYAATADVNLKNATIVRNRANTDDANHLGGGIALASDASATIRNTIIALNRSFASDTNTPDCAIFTGGSVQSLGRNFFSHKPAGLFGCTAFTFPPNILQANPHLGKLRDNGGPTKTIALLRHSKAINRAGGKATKRDQRGVRRHNPDIGAYERT